MLKLLITITAIHLNSISKNFIVSFYITVQLNPHTHKQTQLHTHIHKPFSLEQSDITSWCIDGMHLGTHTHTYILKQTHTHTNTHTHIKLTFLVHKHL